MMQPARLERTCSKCHADKPTDKFSPKRLKSGEMGWQSECKDCRAERERVRRTTSEWQASNNVYKTTEAAKARNLRAGQSSAGKATRKRYATSELGRATSKAARAVWLAQPGVRAMPPPERETKGYQKRWRVLSSILVTYSNTSGALARNSLCTLTSNELVTLR